MTTPSPQVDGTANIFSSTVTTSNPIQTIKIIVASPQSDSGQEGVATSKHSISSAVQIHNEITIKHPHYEAAQAAFKSAQQAKQNTKVRLEAAQICLDESFINTQKQGLVDQALSEDRKADVKQSHAEQGLQVLDLQPPQYEVARVAFNSAQQEKKVTALNLEAAIAALNEPFVDQRYKDALSEDQEADRKLTLAQQKFQILDLQVLGQWNSMYRKLVVYKEKYGHCKVSQDRCFGKEKKTNQKRRKSDDFDDEDPGLQSLARWVGNQRVFYKYHQNGDTKHIKAHRIDALNSLGFVWDIKHHRWMEWYSQLKEYRDINGHSRVSIKDNKELQAWAARQQREFSKMKQGAPYSLGADRIKLLEDLDFEFEIQNVSKRKVSLSPEDLWEQKYLVLMAFHQKHGHSQVNVRSLTSSHNLTDWVAYLRNQYLSFQNGERSILNPKKIALLEALDFQWKKPLSIPRKNCGTKKRKVEYSESKVRQVCSTFENSNAEPAIVTDGGKEDKEDADFALKISQVDTADDVVNYGGGYTGTLTSVNTVNYETDIIDTPMVTGDVRYEDNTVDTPIVQHVVKGTEGTTTLTLQIGRNPVFNNSNSFADNIADRVHIPHTVKFEDGVDTAIVPEFG